MLCQPANLVILDEPTNDLDVPTIAALEQLLVEQASTAIVVTHDRWFLDRCVDRLFHFEKGRLVRFEGNYSAYLEARQAAQAPDRQGGWSLLWKWSAMVIAAGAGA